MTTSMSDFVPLLPIRQTVAFPGFLLPLRVSRSASSTALEEANRRNSMILLVAQKDGTKESNPQPGDLYRVGMLSQIERLRGTRDSGYNVVVRGISRFKIKEIRERDGMLEATGEVWDDVSDIDEGTRVALLESMKSLAGEILDLLPSDMRQFSKLVAGIEDLALFTHIVSAYLDIDTAKKQELLETASVRARALLLLQYLRDTKNNLEVQSEIRDKMSQKLEKQQREHILREQMRQIREELGEGGTGTKKTDFQAKIEAAGMPADVKAVALDELKRLDEIGNSAPEAHVIRNYLDLLCAMPWSVSAQEDIDLERAREILDHDHYGLDKIKKRILQHLAVMKLLASRAEQEQGQESAKAENPEIPILGKEGKRGSILLFVGPPGVGKTSLGQSIARALGRKFVRVSLGGVRDDAEIRGHRRTYIGAMPGRVIQGIKRSGENNPVMMLDEIDKLGASFHGDPAAALLEVLDPEQNNTFTDHYLDVPFDLSRVFFIATANTLETIPGPLIDRMELIELGGYTTAEKFHIARTHLIPKQLREHGLDPTQLTVTDAALMKVINDYTREAGVRNLQRRIAAICRASTEKVLAPGAKLPVVVDVADLDEILGAERYMHEVAERVAAAGVVTGLAWTPVGGEILFIETSLMPGTGKLTLTGQLGDVMKESAQIALSLVRSRLAAAAGAGGETDKRDVHIHVPAGAIPKDGPSAGVAIATALASLYSGIKVDPKLAMTGEITLRGAVMPVGGIKEKAIAAHRAGITRIVLAKQNEKDLRDVPEEVRDQIRFEFVENIADVFRIALGVDVPLNPIFPSPGPTVSPADGAVAVA